MSEIRSAIAAFAKTVPAGAHVLDVGCGLRPYEDCFANCTYVGIDVPVSGREASGKKPDYEFDGVIIPINDAKFDVIICTEVLEHATEPDALLKEMVRVSKPRAQLFLTVPFMWGLHELPYDFRRYTTEGIKQAVTKAGYEIEDQKKLTTGLAALRVLVLSEVNNYKNNVLTAADRERLKFRLIFWIQDKLFDVLTAIWRRSLRFERIYIDNLIIARINAGADHVD